MHPPGIKIIEVLTSKMAQLKKMAGIFIADNNPWKVAHKIQTESSARN